MALVKTVKVSDKGQIAIPKGVREAAGIKRGDELLIIHAAGKLLVGKAEDIHSTLADDFKHLLNLDKGTVEGEETDHHRTWKGSLSHIRKH